MFLLIVGSLLGACAIYCLFAPNVYEARARIALRGTPHAVLDFDHNQGTASGSFAPGLVQIETLANEFRSDELAWNVISDLRLYRATGYIGRFQRKFPTFDPAQPTPESRAYLLDRFQRDLTVETIPRTLVLQIRFRSHDAALSAEVVNALIAAYEQQEKNKRVESTEGAANALGIQLRELRARTERDDKDLEAFQKEHRLLGTLNLPSGTSAAEPAQLELVQVNLLERELADATTQRILREAQYRAASAGNPELVLASDAKLQTVLGSGGALIEHLHTRRSELEEEEAQLRIEHGPNFPRVLEIQGQLASVDRQIKTEDLKITEAFRVAWRTAADREQLVQKSLAEATGTGLKVNEAVLQYAVRRQETEAKREVYVRAMQQAEEAGLAAGSSGSAISVIDHAREPIKPSSPDFLVYMAITLVGSLWVALGAVLLREGLRNRRLQAAVLIAAGLFASVLDAQAPTPSTSGLPTGVARIPQSAESRSYPNAKEAPGIWNISATERTGGVATTAGPTAALTMAVTIGPGDLVEVSEAHTPNQHESVRTSPSGSITLALAGEVHVGGLNESDAALAIEQALIARGMLLRPHVNVLVRASAGQDVTMLGELARPGVYPYTMHHRLLDLISAASGLSSTAGSLVTITHRDDPDNAVPVVLAPMGTDGILKHNPELLPGDTVAVSRAGLVYVVGDVVRPGGFPVDPVQTTTVVQALSLAWGPGQNAALKKAILIREQPGGRTITALNLKRMLRGQDPDMPILDRDILFVPDSMAKNLLNRTMESVIQSAAGVSIYAGLVYSQRF